MRTDRRTFARVPLDERRAYLAVLAHELNQPLTAIASFLEGSLGRIRANGPAPEVEQALLSAIHESRRAAHISRELNEALGSVAHSTEPFDVTQALEEISTDIPRERGARVALEAERDLSLARGDRVQFQHAVLLLVESVLQGADTDTEDGAFVRFRTFAGLEGPTVELQFRTPNEGPAAAPPEGASGGGFGFALARTVLQSQGATLATPVASSGTLTLSIALKPA